MLIWRHSYTQSEFINIDKFTLGICMSYAFRQMEFRSMKYKGPLELRVDNKIILQMW